MGRETLTYSIFMSASLTCSIGDAHRCAWRETPTNLECAGDSDMQKPRRALGGYVAGENQMVQCLVGVKRERLVAPAARAASGSSQ